MLDLLIVGSGPAGLSAAVYAKRSNLDFMVAEQEFLGTGQIAKSFRVDNYLGYYGITGYDLGEKFRLHAEELRVPFHTGEVCACVKIDGGWKIAFTDGRQQEARTLIWAAGTRTRHLNIIGREKFEAEYIHSCAVCDGPAYDDKAVAVVGGGDTALDTALFMTNFCNQVYLIHWMDQFQGNPATLKKLEKMSTVEILPGTSVLMAEGEDRLRGLVLSSGRRIPVDGLFEAVGALPCTDILKGLVELDSQGYIVAGEDGVTSCPGFFAAGDVRTKNLRQVSTAVGDGANALHSVQDYLKTI